MLTTPSEKTAMDCLFWQPSPSFFRFGIFTDAVSLHGKEKSGVFVEYIQIILKLLLQFFSENTCNVE
ncbi:hypothetical protein [Clostridium sp. KNHs216]|uniref:hypothetical protein n=1 Tax=Clostridium sp. KNHs216 TaxID=1550235 RepID=UPI00114E9BF9|nr:hypothetical protein [Clostridium sp. KNHs216]